MSGLLSSSCPEEPPGVCPGGARPWVPARWVLRLGHKPGPLTATRSQTQVAPNARHPHRPSKVSTSASLDRVKVVRSGPSGQRRSVVLRPRRVEVLLIAEGPGGSVHLGSFCS